MRKESSKEHVIYILNQNLLKKTCEAENFLRCL